MVVFIVILLHAWFSKCAGDGERVDFDYIDGFNCRPPNQWSEFYPTCAGNRQSPVDLSSNSTTECQDPLEFVNLYHLPVKIELIHMLHTPLVKYQLTEPILAFGGPLNNITYQFDHYNIRWGAVSGNGSEHTLDGKGFAGEVQLVFFDKSTSGFHEAVMKEDGVAIFSVWLKEVRSPDNSYFDEMLAMLDYVTQPWSYTELCEKIPLKYYLPEDVRNFFTYKGSLTYPPCPQTVTWVVFLDTRPISTYQLIKLRRMIGDKGPIMTNIRPTQRIVDQRIVKVETPAECKLL